MSILITDFLAQQRELSFSEGKTDCCTTADRWIEAVCGFSPLRLYGREILDKPNMEAWLQERGGLPVAVNRVLRKSGFQKTKTPKAGDIGLAFSEQQLCMAIFDGCFWHSRNERGFIATKEIWKAWSVPCP